MVVRAVAVLGLTWVDSGLAVGPLIGGFVVAWLPPLYDALAVTIVVALV